MAPQEKGRPMKQILEEVLDQRGHGGKLGRYLRVNRERNWLLALVLNSFAKKLQGNALNDLDSTIVAAFDEARIGDLLLEHAELYLTIPDDKRKELFPGAFAALTPDSDYTFDHLAKDLPDLDKATLAMPNTTDVDVRAVHSGEVSLRDFPRPSPTVQAQHEGEVLRAVAADSDNPGVDPADKFLIKATSFRCNDETGWDAWGSDEPFWIFGAVGGGIAVTSRSQTFGDVDDGDTRTFANNEGVIWGHDGQPNTLPEGEFGAIIQLWEHDCGDPKKAQAAMAGALGLAVAIYAKYGNLALKTVAILSAAVILVSAIIGFLDDDHIADQAFVLSRQTIFDQLGKAGMSYAIHRKFTDGDADYNLTVTVSNEGQ